MFPGFFLPEFCNYVRYRTVGSGRKAQKFHLFLYFDVTFMDLKLPQKNIAHPWIFGSYAVYAQNLHAARRVYEYASSQFDSVPFGTIELETGEIIDWINMSYSVVSQS